MQILIAPDKFKGSLTASQAARAIADGLHQAHPDWKLDCAPLADGGDGTLDAIESALGGTRHTCTVTGPLGSPVQASYLILLWTVISITRLFLHPYHTCNSLTSSLLIFWIYYFFF